MITLLLEPIAKLWTDRLQSSVEAFFGAKQGAWLFYLSQSFATKREKRKDSPTGGRRFPSMRFAMGSLALLLLSPTRSWAEDAPTYSLGIESMRAHGYSVGIFAFMMLSIAVFIGIMIAFYRMGDNGGVKKGEKVLFVMIGLGVIAASVFAAIQLLDGFLF